MRKPVIIGRRTSDSEWEIIASPDVSPKEQRAVLREIRKKRSKEFPEHDEVLAYYDHLHRIKPKFTGHIESVQDEIPDAPIVEEPLLPQPKPKKTRGRPIKQAAEANFLS